MVCVRVEEIHDLEEKLQREERRYKYLMSKMMETHTRDLEQKLERIKALEQKVEELQGQIDDFLNLDG